MRVAIEMVVRREQGVDRTSFVVVQVEAEVAPQVVDEVRSSEPLLDHEVRRARGLLCDEYEKAMKGETR